MCVGLVVCVFLVFCLLPFLVCLGVCLCHHHHGSRGNLFQWNENNMFDSVYLFWLLPCVRFLVSHLCFRFCLSMFVFSFLFFLFCAMVGLVLFSPGAIACYAACIADCRAAHFLLFLPLCLHLLFVLFDFFCVVLLICD